MATKTNRSLAEDTHLLIVVVQDGSARGYRVLNPPTDYRPLIKELAYRAVANEPAAAGEPWRLSVQIEGAGTLDPQLHLDAFRAEGEGRPLATMRVPVQNLSWLARAMAQELKLTGGFTFVVTVLASDSTAVREWSNLEDNDADFAVTEDDTEMVLPSQFTTDPIGPRRSITRVGSWLRCVLTKDVHEKFMASGAREKEIERAWVGATRIHLSKGGAYTVIEEITEVPAEMAGREYLRAHGRDFLALHKQMDGRLGAFLHLHPSHHKDVELTPDPSSADSVVAWNLDASTGMLVSLPITMFGTEVAEPKIAAHGYVDGLLSEIDLEVLT